MNDQLKLQLLVNSSPSKVRSFKLTFLVWLYIYIYICNYLRIIIFEKIAHYSRVRLLTHPKLFASIDPGEPAGFPRYTRQSNSIDVIQDLTWA